MTAHTCHAKDCHRTVPPRMLMCARHWRMVPADLQADVWATYRRGQEVTKDPSPEYLDAAHAAIEAVAKLEVGGAPAAKALSLWQPWASLISLGVKRVETRSWATGYRGPLAIHAAARPPDLGPIGDVVVRMLGPERVVHRAGTPLVTKSLPLGAVVAMSTLVDVVEIGDPDDDFASQGRLLTHKAYVASNFDMVRPWVQEDGTTWVRLDQEPYGDFTPGRFAWLLDAIEPIEPPAPARGHQQLWDWSP